MNAPASVTASPDKVTEAAMVKAEKWNLVRDDGSLKCARDWCHGNGQVPSLLCEPCLALHRRGMGGK